MTATYPAAHIRDNGTGEFDAARYEEIFGEIIRKVKLHGLPTDKMRCRGAYILKAVQDHWRHNWEQYQPESKSAGQRVEAWLRDLAKRQEVQPAGELRAMTVLAAVHDGLKTGRPKKDRSAGKPKLAKQPAAREIQAELF